MKRRSFLIYFLMGILQNQKSFGEPEMSYLEKNLGDGFKKELEDSFIENNLKKVSKEFKINFNRSFKDSIFYSTFILNPFALNHVAEQAYKQVYETDFYGRELNLNLSIPENYAEERMNIKIIASKKDKRIRIIQKFDGRDILLYSTKTTFGGNGFRSLEEGKYWIKRLVFNPWYYPPKWDGRSPIKPGEKNPFGKYLAEICNNQDIANYDLLPGYTQYAIHATPKGLEYSHGCNRLDPQIAEYIFEFLKEKIPHKEPKKNWRGTVYPIEEYFYIEYFSKKEFNPSCG